MTMIKLRGTSSMMGGWLLYLIMLWSGHLYAGHVLSLPAATVECQPSPLVSSASSRVTSWRAGAPAPTNHISPHTDKVGPADKKERTFSLVMFIAASYVEGRNKTVDPFHEKKTCSYIVHIQSLTVLIHIFQFRLYHDFFFIDFFYR